ncbi:hypothetical protein D5018_00955 [Parashewanella curva]|uniref:Uncharacterized protein n=1 Tax=Parashewanella curva TaxID=2338552 RepID=A0A3L8Q3E1_9GAMM|nr:hypothetical protein [Parashewanella curva]RLV61718.1 hypothetical protein D5018_00955 [Parashewanella curva]
MLSGLLLTASFWVNIEDKQALICNINRLSECIQQLPTSVQQTVSSQNIAHNMAFRDAMVISFKDKTLSGVIFLNPKATASEVYSFIEGSKVQLKLKQPLQLSLWHEQGHLQNNQIIAPLLKRPLTKSEHESFADLYTVWESVNKTKSLELAWQQYHRRNLNVINQESDYSHWSVPLLYYVLEHYNAEDILAFPSYTEFASDLLIHYSPLSQDERREFRSLIKHLFHSHSTFNQRRYLSWRREKFSAYLAPTLDALLDKKQARTLLKSLALPLANNLNHP